MRNTLAVARKDLREFFDAPAAYIVVVVFLLVAGWMFFSQLFLFERADTRVLFTPSPFSPSMLVVILAPAVAMRLIAEERKTGTIELLTTMPITDGQVILGKFLAAFVLLAIALGLTVVYPVTVSLIGPLDWGPVISGYVGMLLFAGSLLAVGLACSTLTESQIVAFIVGFIVCAVLYYVYWLQFFLPRGIAPIVEFLSVSFHLDNMARGVIDSRDVVYYVSLTAAALVLAVRSLSRQHA
jgi:gliding motility-associated transport system permease protein